MTCTRCTTPAAPSDRFCGGCGLERSALSAAVEQAFVDPDPTGPVGFGHGGHRTPGPETVGPDEPDTVGLRIPPSRPAPAAERPRAAQPALLPQASPRSIAAPEVLRWVALGVAALLAVALLVDVTVVWSLQTTDYGDETPLVLLMFPALALVAGAVGVGVALVRRSPVVVAAAATLAAAVVVEALMSYSPAAPGPWSAMLAVGLVALLAAVPVAPGAAPRPGATAVVLTWCSVGGCGVAVLAAISAEQVAGRASPTYGLGAVLFVLLSVVGVGCALMLRGAWAPGPALGPAPAAWILTGSLLVDMIAVGMADDLGVLWAVPVLHAAAAGAALTGSAALEAFGPGMAALPERARAAWATVPWAVVLGGGGGLAVLVGVVLAAGGSSSSSGNGGSVTGATVIITIVGVLAFAAMFTPTMPWYWRGGLLLGGLMTMWIAWAGHEDLTDTRSSLTWIVIFPAALIGGSVWGAVSNHRTGATGTRPGWVGPGQPPPQRPISFVIPPTAGARSRLCLDADTAT